MTNIAESLRSLVVDIDSIHIDPNNSRQHSDLNISAIMGSLSRYGQRKPVVVNQHGNVIEAGNGTWIAAKNLGWTEIAAVFVEDDPTTATGYSIADNRTAELAAWDKAVIDLLNAQQESGEDIKAVGWSDEDIEALATAIFDPDSIEFKEYDESIENEVEYITCPQCGHKWPK